MYVCVHAGVCVHIATLLSQFDDMMYFHRKEDTCNMTYFNYGSEFKSSNVTVGLMLMCQIITGFLSYTTVGLPESCYFSCILPEHHFASESYHQFLSLLLQKVRKSSTCIATVIALS